MEAFSKRERRKIISLYQSGLDTADIAQQFSASESGVRRIWQQFREEGRDEPALANCGRKATLSPEQMQQVRQIVQERPDLFMREVAREVQTRLGIVVCRQTVGRWLRELGITRKKSRSTLKSSSVRMSKPNAMDGLLFQNYVREALLPVPQRQDVVVMDNLSSHKNPQVGALIESVGARLLYLPPYSPDLNPIEMIWSKVK